MLKKNKIPIEHIHHSFAHILAAAVLELYPEAKFGIGPTIEDGFYYDFDLKINLTPKDLEKLEKKMKELIERKIKFERQQLTIEEAKKFFKKNNQPYKIELINDLAKYGTTVFEEIQKIKKHNSKVKPAKLVSLYKTGNFTDLCRGGHVDSTTELDKEAFKLTKVAGAYWRGNQDNSQMQRIYAVAFANKNELIEYLKKQEELQKRDHRKLGAQLDIFSFHDFSPGAPLWHPKGMIIFKELEKLWRVEHEKSGYQEISTPILVKKELWEKSGHWQHYQKNMFLVEIDKEIYSLKPMNCPESTYAYASQVRSYKDLPIRLSEIGHLHRNELSGVLGGLLRVRQITMDDAHIYCRPDQITSEIIGVIALIKKFYKLFGFNPIFSFSTKPLHALGDPGLWDKAEKALILALRKDKIKYNLKEEEGAFYGPKIDVQINDVLGRTWQLATIQLDFQMPERFKLVYTDKNGDKQRPVMIHRAIFGSFERFIGILLEHFGGALPLWLAPIQVAIINIAEGQLSTIQKLNKELQKNNVRTWLLDENETVGKKIRKAELQKISYMLIIGPKEKSKKTVSVRSYKNGDLGQMKEKAFINRVLKEISTKVL